MYPLLHRLHICPGQSIPSVMTKQHICSTLIDHSTSAKYQIHQYLTYFTSTSFLWQLHRHHITTTSLYTPEFWTSSGSVHLRTWFFHHPNNYINFKSTIVNFTTSWNNLLQQMVQMPWMVRGLQRPNPTPVGKQEGWHKPRRPPLYRRHEFESLCDFFDLASSTRVIFPEMVGDNHLQQSSVVKNGEVSMSPLTKGFVQS